MFKISFSGFLVLGGMLISSNMALAAEPAWWTQQKRDCGLPSGLAYNNWDGQCNSSSSNNSGSSGRDFEAERRAQEQAEAARRAEAERQAGLERQRRAEDERRRQEEAARQAKFIRDRDDAANSLRGSNGMRITPNTSGGTALRGSSDLKDAPNDSSLRGMQPAKNAATSGQTRAWQQLHCVAAITGYALKALENGDSREFDTLINEASTKFDGGRPSVECPAAPPMPDLRSSTVNMEQIQGKQKQILDRAGKIAERMNQTEGKNPDAKTSKPAPANETALDKTVRVQRELNKGNQQPVHNQQEENNRKELAKLILANEKLISIDFDKSEESPAPTRRKRTEVPSPTQ